MMMICIIKWRVYLKMPITKNNLCGIKYVMQKIQNTLKICSIYVNYYMNTMNSNL